MIISGSPEWEMEQSARSVRPGHRVTVAILKEATYNHYLFIISWMYKRRQIRRDDVLIQLASTDAFDCLRKQLIEGIRIWFIDVRSTNSPWKCPLKKGNMLNLSMLINMLWGTVEQNEYSHLISINQMENWSENICNWGGKFDWFVGLINYIWRK